MKEHKDFEKRVNKSLQHMKAKISFLRDGVKGLSEAFQEFQEESGIAWLMHPKNTQITTKEFQELKKA